MVIFLPGMFNDLDDGENRRFMLSLSKRGHHVATLPNPLSTDYITAKPNYKPGEFLKKLVLFIGQLKESYFLIR